jgi:hypothetical protein
MRGNNLENTGHDTQVGIDEVGLVQWLGKVELSCFSEENMKLV